MSIITRTMDRAADDEQWLARVARVFQALGEPTRLRILAALDEAERTVTGIVEVVGTSQTSTSRHLTVLHDAGLVKRRRAGRHVLYRTCNPRVAPVCRQIAASLVEESANRLPGRVVRAAFSLQPSSSHAPPSTRSKVGRVS